MTYTAISVIGMAVYVVMDRIVSRWRLQCCRMVTIICQRLMKLFPPTWQHHRLMIVSIIVWILQSFH
jgi:endonuclease III